MATTRYSYTVDLDNLNSSHSLAVLSVPPGSRVLDLGAADGSVARALKQRGCTVWGVEQDQRAAGAAAEVCDRVIVADLETDEAFAGLGNEQFDAILALDVLEHLRNPADVLRRALNHLAADGIVVVSLPNVTHGALRLNLLQGRFQYTELGLLDRTHLRFFDRAAAERLIADAGLTVAERLRVRLKLEETEIPVETDGVPPAVLERLAADDDAETYQFVFVARPAFERRATAPGASLSERLLAENHLLRSRFGEVEAYARSLEGAALAPHADIAAKDVLIAEVRRELERRTEEARQTQLALDDARADVAAHDASRMELRAELERRMEEAHQMRLALRHAKADIAVKEGFIAELRRDVTAADAARAAADAARATADAARATAESSLQALRVYANSAGFRLVEKAIARLKRVPFLYDSTRAVVRQVAGEKTPPREATYPRLGSDT